MTGTGRIAGKILIFGPSRVGKTYLTKAMQGMGLNAVDAEHVDGLIGWFDQSGRPAGHLRDSMPPAEWFANYLFLMDKRAMQRYLDQHEDIVVLGHARNILDCLDLFEHTFYLHISPAELEKRIHVERPDVYC